MNKRTNTSAIGGARLPPRREPEDTQIRVWLADIAATSLAVPGMRTAETALRENPWLWAVWDLCRNGLVGPRPTQRALVHVLTKLATADERAAIDAAWRLSGLDGANTLIEPFIAVANMHVKTEHVPKGAGHPAPKPRRIIGKPKP